MSKVLTRIIIEEPSGIDRASEPVRAGIPFPRGLIKDENTLRLIDPELGEIPIQTNALATWSDGSVKWVLFDFQASVGANTRKEMEIVQHSSAQTVSGQQMISINETAEHLILSTGQTNFYLATKAFKPFDRLTSHEIEILDGKNSFTMLKDETGREYVPLIRNIRIETKGFLRTTIKVEGTFQAHDKKSIASFFARLHFFLGKSSTKIDFTIHNTNAARHPGGLWDLGDPGSIFFKDLCLCFALNTADGFWPCARCWFQNGWTTGNQQPSSYELSGIGNELIVYQDSSGGDNWMSHNHINRGGEIKNSFRGYKMYENEKVLGEDNRITPVMQVGDDQKNIAAIIQRFWQNFPKSVEARGSRLTMRLFPKQYNDVFELQGGERKTHTVVLSLNHSLNPAEAMAWTEYPLIPHAPPEWYEQSGVFPSLISQDNDPNKELVELINSAISGENTFVHRREIIDEYGWRNFGELYADHEAVHWCSSDGPPTRNSQLPVPDSSPLVSHYNNQYDCIYGMLRQFVRTGNYRWFALAHDLCSHVRDIDIYHTDEDRPEFNHGLFWHTEHYIDAQTATHRCFSKRHGNQRNLATYGGGPATSHNYTTGFLYDYYLTGEEASREAMMELTSFAVNNMLMGNTIANRVIKGLKKAKARRRGDGGDQPLVQANKVYGLDGPGRASGNLLNTFVDAYSLSGKNEYILYAETLIRDCISSQDDIQERDLLDTENRWMYTVFLQSLGKYLEVKTELGKNDAMWEYAANALIHYAEWMAENEYIYLDRPDKLEYPNETWAAQDLRKCNILLQASNYVDEERKEIFQDKACLFFKTAVTKLKEFDTSTLTRPLALLMLNGEGLGYWQRYGDKTGIGPASFRVDKALKVSTKERESLNAHKVWRSVSLKRELEFFKWRLFAR